VSPSPGRIFLIAPIEDPLGARLHDLQKKHDPKLARAFPPHLTLAGSSGLGAVHAGTSVGELRRALAPIAAATAPLELTLGTPHRFMQSDVVVLPMDPHGPLRELHDAIGRSGLRFEQPKFTFTPHVTLSFYRELSKEEAAELLAIRIEEPARISRIEAYRTREPQPAERMLMLPLTG
jgi:2'-5' RNA ligase